MLRELMLKIRNYQAKEDYKTSLIYYLEKKMEDYIAKPSILEGYAVCLRDIREIPELVEKMR